MSEALFAVIITSDDRGRPDELSVRDVSVDDTRQGRSPAEHPPSLRTTLLPITIDVSRDVQQGSEPSIRRASRELQLQPRVSTPCAQHGPNSSSHGEEPVGFRRAWPELTLHTSRGRSRMMHRSDGATLTA